MATRVNLPSELRIKSVDTTNQAVSDFEDTDVVIDQDLKTIFSKVGAGAGNWTKMIAHDTVKESTSNADPANYEDGEVLFFTDTKQVVVNNSQTDWQIVLDESFFKAVDTTTIVPADQTNHDTFVGYINGAERGSIVSVYNGQTRYLRKNTATKLVVDIANEDITEYMAKDFVIDAQGVIRYRETLSSTEWTTVFDPAIIGAMDNIEFSVLGTVTKSGGGTILRQLFPKSRGYGSDNIATQSLGELISRSEVNILSGDQTIYWQNGWDPNANRWDKVVGTSIFPKAELFNNTKDTARSITFLEYVNVSAVYFEWDATNSNFVRAAGPEGFFTGSEIIAPDAFNNNGGEIRVLYRDAGKLIYEFPEIADATATNPAAGGFFTAQPLNSTLLATDGVTPYTLPADTIGLIVDATGSKVTTAATAGGTGQTDFDGSTMNDLYLANNAVPKNLIARLDTDPTGLLTNTITVGYRQKAVIRTMELNEADEWGFNTGTDVSDDGLSSVDKGPVFLVSIESI